MESIMHIKLWNFFFFARRNHQFKIEEHTNTKQVYKQITQFDFEKWIGFFLWLDHFSFFYNNEHFMK